MIRRASLPLLLALSLLLGGVASVVAQTRMVAAGGYCGTDAPRLLLDAAGLPLLTDDGTALAAPECPACHVAVALLAPAPPRAGAPRLLSRTAVAPQAARLSPRVVRLDALARAPPPAV